MSRASVLLWSLVAAGLLPLTAAAQVVAPDGWVVLPIDEYRALRERTRPPSPVPLTPVDATFTRVDYELRLDGDAITGRALLTIDVLRDGSWAMLHWSVWRMPASSRAWSSTVQRSDRCPHRT